MHDCTVKYTDSDKCIRIVTRTIRPASSTRLLYMFLEHCHSQLGRSDPWLWDSSAFAPSRNWSSNRRTSLDSFLMSQMLMPSNSVSVDKARFRIDDELCWGAAGPLTRYRYGRFWTRVGSVSDTCLLNLFRVTPVTWGTEPTGLPECCRVRVSRVRFRWYAEYRLCETDCWNWF